MLYAVFAAGGLSQISDVWARTFADRRRRRTAGRTARSRARNYRAAASGQAAGAAARRGRVCGAFGSPIRRARKRMCSMACRFQRKVRREGRHRRPVGRRQEHDLPPHLALLRSGVGQRRLRRRAVARGRSARRARAHRAGAAGQRRVCRDASQTTSASAGRTRRDADIARAAELAAASSFIARLPRGFDTQVGERGVTLSGGAAPAHRHRARHPARCAAAAARRSDIVARRRERDAGAGGVGSPDAGTHDAGDRARWRRCSSATASW